MGLQIEAKDLKDMWIKANLALWNTDDEDFDNVRKGVTVHTFHNQLVAESATIELPLHLLGYSKTKWSMLLKLYFDPDSYRLVIHRLKFYKKEPRGNKFIVDIPFNFKPRFNRTGECLIGGTIRFSRKRGWECEIFTRASESVSRWGVDLVFINVLLSGIGAEVGFAPEEVRLYWNSAQMFQSILTAPLFFCIAGLEKKELIDKVPETEWQEYVIDRYQRAFVGITGKRKYVNYKTQARSVKGYDILKGVLEPRHVLEKEDLWLPYVDLALPEEFMKMGGFK